MALILKKPFIQGFTVPKKLIAGMVKKKYSMIYTIFLYGYNMISVTISISVLNTNDKIHSNFAA